MLQSATLRRVLMGPIIAAVIGGAAADSSAQSRRPQRQQTPPAQPGQQGQPNQAAPGQPNQAAPGQPDWALEPSPYITRERPHRWTITAHMFIGASQWLESQDDALVPRHDTWEFSAATLVYPILPETGSSILEVRGPADKEIPAVTGRVELDDRPLSDTVTILRQGIGGGPLPCGTWRGQWQIEPPEAGAYRVREMEFEVASSIVSYRTKLDERGAREVDWPKGEWPPEAAATFQPQMFVDFDTQGRGYDMTPVADLLREWTDGKDPRTVRPVVLAKYLAGQVLQHVQINGEGLAFDQTGMWQGFDTPGAVAAAVEGRGTEIDLPCLLVAIYRAAGIPARLVIGYDEQSEGKQIYLEQKKGGGAIRVWVEFCLYDEVGRTMGWVPVDITKLRKKQNRLPDNYLDRPLRFFGTHDELDRVAPLAFHFHPPTTVRSYGSPALWGWFVTPTPPGRATQRVDFTITTTPRGGGDESHLPADKQEP